MRTYKLWALALFALLIASCTRHERATYEQAPIRVKTMVIAPHNGRSASRYVGAIEPAKVIPLSLQSTGRVTAVKVKNGQTVHAGQTLLTIDNTQAMNALTTSQASLRHAQDAYDRLSKVHAKGVVSDQKMVEVESQLAQAQALYQAAKKQLEECTLVAPCQGMVDGLKIETGQTIIPGTKLCSILDMSAFSVRFTVPESEIRSPGLVEIGMKGEVECEAVNAVLPIVITEKSISANTITHTYDVVARVQGGAKTLMNGMVAVVRLQQPAPQTTTSPLPIVIPANCILLKPEGPTVWVIEHGNAVRRPVTTGGYEAQGVRITTGLQAGDTLITSGYQKLYNGCSVICED